MCFELLGYKCRLTTCRKSWEIFYFVVAFCSTRATALRASRDETKKIISPFSANKALEEEWG